MRKTLILIMLAVFACLNMAAQSSDNGDGTFTNPVIWADCPDPDVIRVGDDYYFVSTTMHLMPGAPIMHSKDLVNWEIISYIFDRIEETPRYSLKEGTVYGRGQWATSLRYKDGRFYAYFTPNDHPYKGYVYTTEDPRGKWERHAVIPHFHDASFFFDEDGRAYMVYGTGMIRELKPDLTGVLEGGLDMKLFERDSEENSLLEGSRMIKKDGKYYLLMISWPRGGIRREVCYRADRLEGPYEKKVILETTFGGLGDGVAQGTIFDDPQGNWYGMILHDSGGVGSVPMLMRCTWIDGWPMLGDKDGKVPDTMQKPVQGQERKALTVSDEFDSDKMGLCWQWNHNPVDEAWSLTERPGYLRLKAQKAFSLFDARNTLTQRMEGPTCEATVAIDLRNMKDGDRAGFSAFNSDATLLAIRKVNGRLYLSMDEEKVKLTNDTKTIREVKQGALTDEIRLRRPVVYLLIEGDFRPGPTKDTVKFWYSTDNKKWERLGPDCRTSFDWQRFFMGTKFAIFNYTTAEEGGYIDIDWFRYKRNN